MQIILYILHKRKQVSFRLLFTPNDTLIHHFNKCVNYLDVYRKRIRDYLFLYELLELPICYIETVI